MNKVVILLLIGLLIIPFVEGIECDNYALYSTYEGLKKFGVDEAWNMGCTGKGVKIAIIDNGIDFATPDLIGTQARISNSSSPYDGWPIVVDLYSLSSYHQGLFGVYTQYANTTSTNLEGYQITNTSKSGIYHTGDHPDRYLTKFYGEAVKVLVVDEKKPNVYDTVYVDLNNNHDFRDDKPCRKGDEISCWDRDNDSYPDESGGMIYFIADGKTPLPLSRMLYGEETKIPKNGEVVAFHLDSSNHGTMCAGIITGQGKNVLGIAPDARLIPVRAFLEDDMLLCLLASLGYDGIPNTGDEANIISESGNFPYLFNKGADEGSAFLEYLTTEITPFTTIVYGNGNDGSGYSTCGSPCNEHVINVGAIYDLWWNGSSYSGDVTCFSSRGPNALGQVKPNVLATGYRTPRPLPLWETHDGNTSWDGWGAGTSGATPHVAAVVALIYQVHKDTYGEFPTSEKARDILMSSATDINEEVFAQGAGIINAKSAVEVASEKNGVLIEPALLITPPIEAGSNLEFNFTISNYSNKSFNINPKILVRSNVTEKCLESARESVFFTISRDMLDCDLVKISSYYQRDKRSTMLNKEEGYDLSLYNWKDTNVDFETQYGELETIALNTGDWGYGFTSEVRMHHPAERTDDGLVIGLSKRGEINSEEVQVVIETYKWVPWNIEVNIDGNNVHVSIPTPNTTGVVQGKLIVEEDGKEHCIPISFSTYRDGKILIKHTENIYENAKIYGRFEGDGKKGWDSRVYPIYYHDQDLATIEVTWVDPNTDIDVYLYGEDLFNTSKLWRYPTKPPIELPKLRVLKENGHSLRIMGTLVEGTTYGPSYSTFYTSTGKNREVITGVLREGLNLIILQEEISGGKQYGEDINITVNFTPYEAANIRTNAGDVVTYQPAGVDAIIGFSSGEEFEQKKFQANDGDVILTRSNETSYFPQIIFDSNKNGMIDDGDEMIFSEERLGGIEPMFTDIIPLHKRGTYFLSGYCESCEFYHMDNRYHCNASAPITIKAPEQSGVYFGIPEINGNLISVPIQLVVEAKEPVSIQIDMVNITGRNSPIEMKLELQDEFGNLVEDNITAMIEFNDATRNVDIVTGRGAVTLTAPDKIGLYKIKISSIYSVIEKDIEIADKPLIEMNNSSVNELEITKEKMGSILSEVKKNSPEKVQSISIHTTGEDINLAWQASERADHYNVYLLKRNNPEKLADVKNTQYTMKGELWERYTFLISALNGAGNESEMSTPIGTVVTPQSQIA